MGEITLLPCRSARIWGFPIRLLLGNSQPLDFVKQAPCVECTHWHTLAEGLDPGTSQDTAASFTQQP